MTARPAVPDPWHYPRTGLADAVLGLFAGGLGSALTFFAPRRMGKTEFLRKDITPAAQARGWGVFYFSFLDEPEDVRAAFVAALGRFVRGDGWLARMREHLPGRLQRQPAPLVRPGQPPADLDRRQEGSGEARPVQAGARPRGRIWRGRRRGLRRRWA